MLQQRFIMLVIIAIVTVASPGLSWMQSTNAAYAQAERTVKCGEIIESELTKDLEASVFLLTMQPRESFSVSLEPVGDHLLTSLGIMGPTGIPLGITDQQKTPSVESGTLSARGTYKIIIKNAGFNGGGVLGGIGIYTLYIGCVKSDGSIIKPGDIPQPTPTPAPLPTPTVRAAAPETKPAFKGIGFPGLAPVDFSSVAKVPLVLDTVMTGVIPTGNEILGFTLDAKVGDTLDLSYTRVSGNMNLGLVVLSEKNEVFFQASLVTSAALSTRFTLPTAGKYTIGVFRISLVEPAKVEPTVFQLQGILNPAK